jgi:hypothetical protein
MPEYKQKCMVCKNVMVLMRSRKQKPICAGCRMGDAKDKPITDPAMQELFGIDERLYERNAFLADIKAKYVRFGSLSERQIEVFRRVAKEEADKLASAD